MREGMRFLDDPDERASRKAVRKMLRKEKVRREVKR